MKTLHLFTLLLVSLFSVNQAQADIWAEREGLAKIESEIASLETLVMNTKAKSNAEDRMTFNYEELMNDLRKIRSGVATHLSVPMEPVVPSNIDALNDSYTEHR